MYSSPISFADEEPQNAPFPHCNSMTIHTPGECFYCDKYPRLQEGRRVSGLPFTDNEANGWSGNVAVKQGQYHQHMGFGYIVGADTETCRHCGDRGPVGEDHTCPCPYRDEDCPNH